MKFDTETAADHAANNLQSLLDCATRDSQELSATGDIPANLAHFAAFRSKVDELESIVKDLKEHVKHLSEEVLPTLFLNQNITTIIIPGLGRCTVNRNWRASMIDKEASMKWLRDTGNAGLIIETVSSKTLTTFARDMADNNMPLPEGLFKVVKIPHMSITKG